MNQTNLVLFTAARQGNVGEVVGSAYVEQKESL